ncbi:MAG: tRNA epoxyqueuosine(34) reductase QueG [Nitrospinota bacterium]|nr:tRNA epoxyqueuosine(34) reductase QueG [Nitrospinota bacterium]
MTESKDIRKKLDKIRHKALELGFEGFGVALPDVAEAGERFQQWLDRNFHGEMHYMERGGAKRQDLDLVLPGVKSIICLSTPYFTAPRTMKFLEDSATGDISNYARNLDYHDLIQPRLRELEACLAEQFPGCSSKSYVDTGPVLEKPLAQRAGLGWIGKHTNLLTEGVGSYYFLSEILVDVALPSSEPAENHCGTCTACIDICPTGAIVAPYVLDSRKCISYLTIELKGAIPHEYRRALGNRIYGCDDCQIVCPWNSYAVATQEPAFQEREGTKILIELMQLDDEGFRARFRKSPVKRIKRRGLLRNVAVALGNSGFPEAVPVLTRALSDPEPLIRSHAIWALGELLGKRALETVEPLISGEMDALVLNEVRRLKTV